MVFACMAIGVVKSPDLPPDCVQTRGDRDRAQQIAVRLPKVERADIGVIGVDLAPEVPQRRDDAALGGLKLHAELIVGRILGIGDKRGRSLGRTKQVRKLSLDQIGDAHRDVLRDGGGDAVGNVHGEVVDVVTSAICRCLEVGRCVEGERAGRRIDREFGGVRTAGNREDKRVAFRVGRRQRTGGGLVFRHVEG